MSIIYRKKINKMFSWFMSYVLVFSLPLFAFLFIYFSYEKIVLDDINEVSNYVISQIRLNFDSITTGVDSLATQIAKDSKINQVRSMENFDASDRLTIREAMKNCLEYKASAVLIDDFFIYFDKSNSVLRYNSFYESGEIEDFLPKGKKNEKIWTDIISGKCNHKVFSYSYFVENGRFVDCVTYVIPINIASSDKTYLIASIDSNKYKKIAASIYAETDFAILDADDIPIFCSSDKITDEELTRVSKENKDNLITNNQRYFINKQISKDNNLKYLSITSKKTALKKVIAIRYAMVICYLLCVIIGVAFSLYFTKHNYKPMREIIGILSKHKLIKSGYDSKEEKLLIGSITELIEEKSSMKNKLHRQKRYVENSTLSMLVNNRLTGEITPELIKEMCDIDFSKKYFSVLLFHIYNSESKSFSDVNNYESKLFVIKYIFEELFKPYFISYITDINGLICAILNFDDISNERYEEIVCDVIDFGKKANMESFGMEIAIASSLVHEGIDSVSECYNEAALILNNLIFRNSKELLFYDSFVKNYENNYEYLFSFGVEQKLIQYLKMGDSDNSIRIINEIISAYETAKVKDMIIIRIFIFDVLATIVKAMGQIPGINPTAMLNQFKAFEKNDINTLRRNLNNIVISICENAKINAANNENTLVNKIIEIIEKDCVNINFNVEYIADELNMNAKYLSRVFAEKVGCGVHDYTNKIRIERAKTLLTSTELSVENIGTMVGFASSNTFIRVLKKYENMTPGQYRAAYTKEI